MFKTKFQRNLTIFLSIVYMIILIWLVLFKFEITASNLDHIRTINLIPFHQSVIVNGKIQLSEIICNVLVFIPLGIYTGIYKSNWSFIKKVLVSLILSLIFETLQYLFAIGGSDITDVIANTLGGIIGIYVYELLSKIFKNKTITVINILASIIALSGMSLFALLTIANI